MLNSQLKFLYYYFRNKVLFWKNVRYADIRKSYEDFSYVFHPVSSNVNTLHSHSPFVRIKTLTLVRCY